MPTPRELMQRVNSLVGPGAVRLGSSDAFKVRQIPTGVAPVDHLLGGGVPRGRMTEFYGDFSTCKSLIALRAIASVQESGGTAALIDAEHSYDPEWAVELGVDVDSLILQLPPNGETAFDAMEVLIRDGVDLLVVDSVAALLPVSEEKTKLSDKSIQPARLAALMSTGTRKLTAANTGATAVVFINQLRDNVGVTFGATERPPGGKALAFYASWRVMLKKAGKLRREAKVWDGDKYKTVNRVYGEKFRVTVEKSKLGRPHGEVFFDYDVQRAEIDELGFLVALAMEEGLITTKGQMWTLNGSLSVRGRERFYRTLDAEVLRKTLGLPGAPGRPNRPASSERKPSSKPGVRAGTPVRGRAASGSTVPVRRSSSRSSPPVRGDLFSDYR